ncbi:MAG: VanW family protein [Fimbriimonadaceae bacterium]|nr:VanW family protein [Fimbriimonadaceae bacterium]
MKTQPSRSSEADEAGEQSHPNNRFPTPVSNLKYRIAVQAFRWRRRLLDSRLKIARFEPLDIPKGAVALAESRTPLWSETDPAEQRLQMGKVQNLRIVCRAVHNICVPAGETFSFWKQVGYPGRGRGFVSGRQLQEGCIVPAIAGGICQLSNALHDLALQTGLEIVERHGHSRQVPNSSVAAGRDATVAWNYIDLRFKAKADFYIQAFLTADEMVVRILGTKKQEATLVSLLERKAFRANGVIANSCETCGQDDCYRHGAHDHTPISGKTAYLVDQRWPEYNAYIRDAIQPEDTLCAPIDAERFRMARYSWSAHADVHQVTATLPTLRRSWISRKLASQGPELRKAAFRFDEELARCYAGQLMFDVRRLCVYQSLLPFLWRDGVLGGRTFDVLMQRLPIFALQEILDEEFAKHPERRLLADYRAPDWVVKAEREALEAADRIITPHAYIASLFPDKAVLLNWHMPNAPANIQAGNRVAFPGPSIARKGAYEVRDAALRLGISLSLTAANHEGDDFWDEVDVRRPDSGKSWLDGVGLVVQPALLEDQPRKLLEALALGIPVIATRQCGLGERDGVTVVDYGGTEVLVNAIRAVTST